MRRSIWKEDICGKMENSSHSLLGVVIVVTSYLRSNFCWQFGPPGEPRHRATEAPSHDDDKISSYRVVCVCGDSLFSFLSSWKSFSFERERGNVSLCACVRVLSSIIFIFNYSRAVCVHHHHHHHHHTTTFVGFSRWRRAAAASKTPRETLLLRGGRDRKCHHVT